MTEPARRRTASLTGVSVGQPVRVGSLARLVLRLHQAQGRRPVLAANDEPTKPATTRHP